MCRPSSDVGRYILVCFLALWNWPPGNQLWGWCKTTFWTHSQSCLGFDWGIVEWCCLNSSIVLLIFGLIVKSIFLLRMPRNEQSLEVFARHHSCFAHCCPSLLSSFWAWTYLAVGLAYISLFAAGVWQGFSPRGIWLHSKRYYGSSSKGCSALNMTQIVHIVFAEIVPLAFLFLMRTAWPSLFACVRSGINYFFPINPAFM